MCRLFLALSLLILFTYDSESSDFYVSGQAGETVYFQNATLVAQKIVLQPGSVIDSISLEIVGPQDAQYTVALYSSFYDEGVPDLSNPINRQTFLKKKPGMESAKVVFDGYSLPGRIAYISFASDEGVMLASDRKQTLAYCIGKRGEEFRTQFIYREGEWEASPYNFKTGVWLTFPDQSSSDSPMQLKALSEQRSRGLNMFADDIDSDGDIDLFYGGQLFTRDNDSNIVSSFWSSDTILTFVRHHDYTDSTDILTIRQDSTGVKKIIVFDPLTPFDYKEVAELNITESPISYKMDDNKSPKGELTILVNKEEGLFSQHINLENGKSSDLPWNRKGFTFNYRNHSNQQGHTTHITEENKGVFAEIASKDRFVTGIAKASQGNYLKPESFGYSVGDIDGDSLKDIVLYSDCNCKSISIFKNTGAGFENVTHEWGIPYMNIGPDGLLVDYDLDGDLDIFSASDGVPVIIENGFDNGSPKKSFEKGSDIDFSMLRYLHHTGGILKQGPTESYKTKSRHSTEKIQEIEVKVFPNPNNGRFNIDLDVLKSINTISGYIYTQDMRKITTVFDDAFQPGNYQFTVDLEDYGQPSNGTYIIIIKTDQDNLILNTVVNR